MDTLSLSLDRTREEMDIFSRGSIRSVASRRGRGSEGAPLPTRRPMGEFDVVIRIIVTGVCHNDLHHCRSRGLHPPCPPSIGLSRRDRSVSIKHRRTFTFDSNQLA